MIIISNLHSGTKIVGLATPLWTFEGISIGYILIAVSYLTGLLFHSINNIMYKFQSKNSI